MIDHVSVRVRDFEKSKKFYSAVLEVVRYRTYLEDKNKIGFWSADGSSVWIRKDNFVTQGMHFAFRALNKEEVETFYNIGLENGGRDNGKPGTRPHRGIQYLAFILDPDGNNMEIVYDPAVKSE